MKDQSLETFFAYLFTFVNCMQNMVCSHLCLFSICAVLKQIRFYDKEFFYVNTKKVFFFLNFFLFFCSFVASWAILLSHLLLYTLKNRCVNPFLPSSNKTGTTTALQKVSALGKQKKQLSFLFNGRAYSTCRVVFLSFAMVGRSSAEACIQTF